MERDETIEYYHRRAGEYDRIYFRNNTVRQGEIAQLYALSRRTLAGRNVLDLACGTGFWTKIISEKAASITGIDINDATLAEARKKRYLCPIEFARSDYFSLPFPAASFDGLLATFVLSHVRRQDISRLHRNIRGALKAGSVAFFCDNNLASELIPEQIWDEDHVNSYKKRWLENGDEFFILKNYFDREELVNIFEKWGRIDRLYTGEYYWGIALTLK